MPGLLGPNGQPISTFAKAPPPKTGPSYGNWAGRDMRFLTLPGGGVVQFDLSKLTLQDFRTMRDHYQVNSSLAVLSFMQHQSDWHIEGSTDKINEHCSENLHSIWTQLNRALSQANWAGYSPNVLEWENDSNNNAVVLNKVKDLLPEECAVHWKQVDGFAPPGIIPPKFKVFNGMIQAGTPYPIPPGNAFWYPILMENGDYYGRKLLRPAFTSYFFSFLMHLYANRYYERFGEPVPIGRAPFEDEIDIGTIDAPQKIRSTDYMLGVLQNLRNRSVVVLPADRGEDNAGRGYFEYDLQYLESQMRGADFERYMERLDEEISLALFTPILLMKTADVGSYNLGVGHMQMYLWMLNAMNDDRATYINRYILSPMTDINFSPNAPRPKIVFRKLGNTNAAMIQAMIVALLQGQQIKVDLVELGQMAGMTLTEINGTVATPPNAGLSPDSTEDPTGTPLNGDISVALQPPALGQLHKALEVSSAISHRVRAQVENAFRDGKFNNDFKINMGYGKQLEQALIQAEIKDPRSAIKQMYSRLNTWADDMSQLGTDYTSNANDFMGRFDTQVGIELAEIAKLK